MRRLARLGAALAAAAALAACALSTPPAHEQTVRSALPSDTAVPPNWKAQATSAAVGDDWLRSFDDPALDRLVAEAIAFNRDLAQAAERVRITQQAVVVVWAQMLPQVGASLGGRSTQDQGNDGSFNSTIAYAGVAWELDLWGRLRAKRAASEASAQATALDFAYARQSLTATVAKAWYLSSEARQQLALANRAVQVYGELMAMVKIRRDAGKDSDLNVADIGAKLDAAKAQVEVTQVAYDEARRALEVLLGRYPAAEIEASAAFPALPPPVAAGVPASLLERRPDLVAAEQQVLAAFRREESARLALLPDLSISLVGGRLGDQLLSTLQLNPWLATAAIGLSIPIYEGGALRARVQIANAQQAQAVAAYGAAVLRAFLEVENALGGERLIARRLPFDAGALQNASDAVRIATVQYRAGKQDLLWVSNLQTTQLAAQSTLIRVQGQQRANRIQLHLAVGAVSKRRRPWPVQARIQRQIHLGVDQSLSSLFGTNHQPLPALSGAALLEAAQHRVGEQPIGNDDIACAGAAQHLTPAFIAAGDDDAQLGVQGVRHQGQRQVAMRVSGGDVHGARHGDARAVQHPVVNAGIALDDHEAGVRGERGIAVVAVDDHHLLPGPAQLVGQQFAEPDVADDHHVPGELVECAFHVPILPVGDHLRTGQQAGQLRDGVRAGDHNAQHRAHHEGLLPHVETGEVTQRADEVHRVPQPEEQLVRGIAFGVVEQRQAHGRHDDDQHQQQQHAQRAPAPLAQPGVADARFDETVDGQDFSSSMDCKHALGPRRGRCRAAGLAMLMQRHRPQRCGFACRRCARSSDASMMARPALPRPVAASLGWRNAAHPPFERGRHGQSHGTALTDRWEPGARLACHRFGARR